MTAREIERRLRQFEFVEGGAGEETSAANLMQDAADKMMDMRKALKAADACFESLDPRKPSGLSDAETATLWNATRDLINKTLE